VAIYNIKKCGIGNKVINNIIRGKKMKWTKEQEKAIFEKNHNILVAAAAREWKNGGFG